MQPRGRLEGRMLHLGGGGSKGKKSCLSVVFTVRLCLSQTCVIKSKQILPWSRAYLLLSHKEFPIFWLCSILPFLKKTCFRTKLLVSLLSFFFFNTLLTPSFIMMETGPLSVPEFHFSSQGTSHLPCARGREGTGGQL